MSKRNQQRGGNPIQSQPLHRTAVLRTAVLDRAIHPCVESLEGRRLLSAGTANWGPLDATVVKGFQFDYRNGIVSQTDGKILVAGYVGTSGVGTGRNVAVARYNTNGSLDSGYGSSGVAVLSLAGDQEGKGIAIDSSGNAVVAVKAKNGGTYGFAVARFTPAGAADTTFSGDGYADVNFNSGNENAAAIATRPDGRIVVGGAAQISSAPGARYDFAIAQFNTNGTLDSSFDGDGKLTNNAVSGNSDQITDMVLQPDGKIVVAGSSAVTGVGDGTAFVVKRFAATGGSGDATFNGGAAVVTTFGAGTVAGASGITLQSDGKVVASGSVTNTSSGDVNFGIARYTSVGTLDTSFDGDGKATINFGSTDIPGSVAMQTLGGTQKIVVSGSSGSHGDIAIARLNLNGSLDTSFDTDGKATFAYGDPDTDPNSGVERVPGLAIQTLTGPFRSNILTAGVNTADGLILTSVDANTATLNTVYVDDNWTIINDTGPAGYSNGDTLYNAGHNVTAVAGVDGFDTIQGGIDAVNSGGTVRVFDGTYTRAGAGPSVAEVTKPLSLVGENAGIAGTGVRNSESIIDGQQAGENYYLLNIIASNVTVTGFEIRHPNYTGTADLSGILFDNGVNHTNIHVTDNIIHDLGATNRPSAAGTMGINGDRTIGLEIDNNLFYNIGNADAGSFAFGVLLYGENATDKTDDVNVHDNTFHDITHVNFGYAIDFGGDVEDAIATSNTITNSSGGIRTSSAMTGVATITNNTIGDGIRDIGIAVYAGGAIVTGNTFVGTMPNPTYDGKWFDGAASYAASIPTIYANNTFPRAVFSQTGAAYHPSIWANIQGGVNGSVNGDTVTATAGTFKENTNVNKSVTILGANAGTAGNASRAAESVIQTNGNQNAVVTVTASDVTIDGFKVTGDDPSVTGLPVQSGVDANALYAITNGNTTSGAAINGLTVRNDIIERAAIGVFGNGISGPSTTSVITANLFQDLGVFDFGYAVSLRNNFYANVTNNVMRRVYTGLLANNFSVSKGSPWLVQGNDIESYANGIWHNQSYGSSTPMTLDSNTLKQSSGPAVANNIGILFTLGPGGNLPVVTNNTITGHDYGMIVWGTPGGLSLGSTNSITGADVGIYVTNNVGFNPIGTTSLGLTATPSSVVVDGMTISAATTGIRVRGDSGGGATSVTVQNDTNITGGGTGILVEGPTASAVISNNDNSINGNAIGIDVNGGSATINNNHIYDNGIGIRLTNAGTASVTNNNFVGPADNGTDIQLTSTAGSLSTLTGNAFAGNTFFIDDQATQNIDMTAGTGNTMDLANNFRIEDHMHHRVDTDLPIGNGLVTWVANNIYVTDAGTDHSIQRGTDAATAGDNVNVEAGAYNENVSDTKSIHYIGAQAGVDARGRVAAETVWTPAVATTAQLTISHNGLVTVDGFSFSGGSSATQGCIFNNSGPNNGMQIVNNRFSNYSTAAIWLARSGTDITIDKNVLDGGNLDSGGTNQAIFLSTNSYNGLAVTNNNIINNKHRYGLFVDGNHNVGESATRAPHIDNNLFDNNLQSLNLGSRSFGTLAAPVLGAYGGYIVGNTFSNNTANGIQAGIQHVLLSQNTFSTNAISGLALTSFGNTGADRGAQNSVISENFFSGSTSEDVFFSASQAAGSISTNTTFNNSFGSNTAVTYNGTETINVSGNWWGSNTGPTVANHPTGTGKTIGGTGAGNIDFTPWLNSGTDTAGGTLGFQGDFSVLHVDDDSPQSGATGRINEGVADLTPVGTIFVHTGTYAENASTAGKAVTFSPGASPGQVNITGNLTFDSNDTYVVELNGTAAAQYDSLHVTGTVTLGNANLSVTTGFTPSIGDSFMIVEKISAGAVSGNFSGKPEGSTFFVSGVPLTITYVGGDGNDVVLSANQPNTVWVNDTWVEVANGGGTPGVVDQGDTVNSNPGMGDAVVNGKTFGFDAFATVQDGANAVSTGGTVNVLTGSYTENVTIPKSESLVGPYAATTGFAGGRGINEATITASGSPDAMIEVNASNVSIAGFTISGGGNALRGIRVNEFDNVTVTNNRINNVKGRAIQYNGTVASGNTGGAVSGNLISGLVSGGPLAETYGVLAFDASYVAVTNNVMTGVDVGMYEQYFYQPNSGGNANNVVSGNTITAALVGYGTNERSSAAATTALSNNNFTLTGGAGSVGVQLYNIYKTNGITLSNTNITGADTGVYAFISGGSASISGGTIDGNGGSQGIQLTNYLADFAAAATGNGDLTIDGVTITDVTTGVFVEDHPSGAFAVHATITNDTNITASGTGILVSGPDASADITNNDNSISGAATGIQVNGGSATINNNHIFNNGVDIDVVAGSATITNNLLGANATTTAELRTAVNGLTITGNTFQNAMQVNGKRFAGVGTSYNIPALYANNIWDTAVDVRDGSSVYQQSIWANIQGGINAANPSDFLHAHHGTYNEQAFVNKTLTLEGDNVGVPGTAVRFTESIVRGATQGAFRTTAFNITANDVVIDGFTVRDTNSATQFGPAILLNVGTHGTHISNNIITNNVTGIDIANNSAIDATVIDHNWIHDNSLSGPNSGQGIYADQFTAGANFQNVNIHHNTIAEPTGNAVDFSGSGAGWADNMTVANNTLSSDGTVIYSQDMTNFTVTSNTITVGTFRGIAVFDGGAGGGSNLNISNNTITANAANLTGNRHMIQLEVNGGTNTVSGNSVTLSGTLSATTTTGGISVIGNNTSTLNLANNNIQGGGALGGTTDAIHIANIALLNYTDNVLAGFTSGGDITSVPKVNYTASASGTDTFVLTATTMQDNGNQAINYSGTTTLDVYTLGGNDTVTVSGAAAGLTTWVDTGTGTADTVNWEGTAGADDVRFITAPTVGPDISATEAVYYNSGAQRVNIANAETRRIRTFAGDDNVQYVRLGGSVATGFTIETGDDNDSVVAGLGDDTVFGGNGNDRLDGANGNDSIEGEAGDDILFGGVGNDILRVGSGSNQAYGQNGNDTIFADNGTLDFVDGGAGFDSAKVDGIDQVQNVEALI